MFVRILLALTLLITVNLKWVFASNFPLAPITVVTEIAPPLQFMNGEQLDGQTTRQVRDLLSRSGLEAKFEVYPWARSYQLAQTNSNTLIYPMVRTPERENKFQWVGRLMTFNISIIQLNKSSTQPLSGLDQAKQLKIGLMRNDYAHQLLSKAGFIEGQHFQLSSELSHLLSLLFSGKIDAMVADLPLLKVMALSQGFAANQLVATYSIPDQQVDVYLAASKQTDQAIIKQLRQHLP